MDVERLALKVYLVTCTAETTLLSVAQACPRNSCLPLIAHR